MDYINRESEWYKLLEPYQTIYEYSPVIFILGMRNTGKSALGYYILEQLRALGFGAQAYGFPPKKYDILPYWIQPVWNDNLNTVPMNTAVIFDEAYMHFLSRNPGASANKLIGGYVGTSRHRNQPLIYIAQIARMLDINIKSYVDILCFKQPGLMQEHFERDPVMSKFIRIAKDSLMKYPDRERKRFSYVFSDAYEGLISNGLASFWSEHLSKVYSTDITEPKFTILRKMPDPEAAIYALEEMTGMNADGTSGIREKDIETVVAKYGKADDYDAFMTLISYLTEFGIAQYDQKEKRYRITQSKIKEMWKKIE